MSTDCCHEAIERRETAIGNADEPLPRGCRETERTSRSSADQA
ncbi:hypothetical protein HSR121_1940 [Halapricum desulfuricans]|uniref:Uncharacterized protein n=1 Tax=Halapricum desulfuricans TaxID=2841257 RepID=A0A897N0R3_9EURY|nr:hypothetical protein HSR121_1940 [Halapricum desulfuricans]